MHLAPLEFRPLEKSHGPMEVAYHADDLIWHPKKNFSKAQSRDWALF
jgi:hypothetical protein